MRITNITLTKSEQQENSVVKATANIVFDDCFVIHGVRVIESKDHLVVAMPSRKTLDNNWMDICHPIKKELRDEINKKVIEKYNE